MNGTIKFTVIAIALCGAVLVAAAPAMASESGGVTGPTQPCGRPEVAPPGPEADQYLQHYQGTQSAKYAGLYWCNLIMGIKNPRDVSLAPPGPEADPYLQHYKGTPSARYASLFWHDLVMGGKDPADVPVAPPGPEADTYLEHYQGTPSAKYKGLK